MAVGIDTTPGVLVAILANGSETEANKPFRCTARRGVDAGAAFRAEGQVSFVAAIRRLHVRFEGAGQQAEVLQINTCDHTNAVPEWD